jgi:multiple antibiotic resistance protein
MVAVLFIFGLFGDLIFQMYGITIPAFRIAGGALLFTVALAMMQGRPVSSKITESEKAEALEKDQVGIVPLGIPMFAGPGAITTVMILVSGFSQTGDYVGYTPFSPIPSCCSRSWARAAPWHSPA